MRIDHHAYQRATRVAGFGLMMQIGIAVLLLLFGSIARDTPSFLASLFALPGILVWLGLVIIFHQHKLERLEALEEDELTATRAAAGSFFERAADETRVSARRLALMHKWLMPSLSILIAIVLLGLAFFIWRFLDSIGQITDTQSGITREFLLTSERGWAIAICLGVAAVSFIFSRFVAGMAKQPIWQNLRGGAAYMVGNALVLLAVSTGIIFRFFDNNNVIEAIGYTIPVVMTVLAAEIILNFILNLYRPRIPGDVPRPAFDSKILSLFATPDSIVRSLNEAVNYQFGFDITSSWGYQLLLRSFVSLLILGVAALLLLSTMVIVEPHQQAVRLRGGAIVKDSDGKPRVYGSGVMWKWPWPIESAEIHDVTRMRSIHLTARVLDQQELPPEQRLITWGSEPPRTDVEFEPFIVGSPSVAADRIQVPDAAVDLGAGENEAQVAEERAVAQVSDFFSLVDAEITVQYRIQSQNGALFHYLQFAPDAARKRGLSDRERALKNLALGEVSRHFASLSLDDVLSLGRTRVTDDLTRQIQAAFDRHKTGVEVVSVNLPLLRPSGTSAPSFEEVNVSAQARLQRIAQARRTAFRMAIETLGNAGAVEEVLAGIDEYERLAQETGADSPQAIEQRQKVQDLLIKGGGWTAQELAQAETDRWTTLASRRAQASRVNSQLALYRAAPELYRHREIMKVYKRLLPGIDKYIIAIDPANVSVNADLTKVAPIFEFAGASDEELQKK
jgi:membrane protease subunit HflK